MELLKKIKDQFPVLLRRNFRLFCSYRGIDIVRIIILLAGPVFIGLTISWVLGGSFSSQLSINICALMIMVMSAIYIGIFNSLLIICNEKQILKYEFISGVSPSAYVLSIATVHLGICLIQAFLFTHVYVTKLQLPMTDFLLGKEVNWLISFFLILYASDMLGLLLSSLSPNGETANFLSPICLIGQILFSGTVWPMDNLVSRCMIARWGMASLGSLIDMGNIHSDMTDLLSSDEQRMLNALLTSSGYKLDEFEKILSDRFISLSGIDISLYQKTGSHIVITWGYLIIIIIVLLAINVLVVRMVKFRRR